jgi:hypothetical protein
VSESLTPPPVDDLVESHDSPEDILKTLQEQQPELPDRFQDMPMQELLDLPITTGTDEEAEQLANYLLWDREMAKRYDKAQDRME